jgi:predicted dehydrogenase
MNDPNDASKVLGSTRRDFLRQSALAAPLAATAWAQASPAAEPSGRKIKLGLIGCGGRGTWLCDLFQKHGGYVLHAVADYFPEQAEKTGERFGVDKARRFTGLSAYRKLLASGVEAVAVVNVPRFHPEHGAAAIEAGCHVFAAKPVAIDVPGAERVRAAGKLATQKKLCYLVDYQLPTDPINIEVVKRVHQGGLGRLAHVDSIGFSPPWGEPPVSSIEDRIRSGRWLSTIALSGDVITENTIHSINAVLWLVGRRPVRAIGRSARLRPNPRDDYREVYLVTYEFDDGALWTHRCQSLNNQLDWALNFTAFGDRATATISYRGKSYLKGGPLHYGGGTIDSLYDQGAIRNIATFHTNIVAGRCDNPTVPQAADDALTAALGREAATRGGCLAMDDLIRENKPLPLDLSGLKG